MRHWRGFVIHSMLGVLLLIGLMVYCVITPGKLYYGSFTNPNELKHLKTFAKFIPIQGDGVWLKQHFNDTTSYCFIGKAEVKKLALLRENMFSENDNRFSISSFFDWLNEMAKQNPDRRIILPRQNIKTIKGMSSAGRHQLSAEMTRAYIIIFYDDENVWIEINVRYNLEALPLLLRLGLPWGEPPGI